MADIALSVLAVPRIRNHLSASTIIAAATVLLALVAQSLAYVRPVSGPDLDAPTLNVAAQMALPNWVKARSLAVYPVVFNGVAAERPAT